MWEVCFIFWFIEWGRDVNEVFNSQGIWLGWKKSQKYWIMQFVSTEVCYIVYGCFVKSIVHIIFASEIFLRNEILLFKDFLICPMKRYLQVKKWLPWSNWQNQQQLPKCFLSIFFSQHQVGTFFWNILEFRISEDLLTQIFSIVYSLKNYTSFKI